MIALSVAAFAMLSAQAFSSSGAARKQAAEASQASADNCSSCHQKTGDKMVALFARSIHARAGLTCSRCHKGDASAEDKAKAHAREANFVGMPASAETLAMCGSCHRAQNAAFKTSRHFPERKGVTRVDCVQCHGAHTVGAASRNFSFAYFCAGCHGLEYLPELESEFKQMLALADELTDLEREMGEAGRAFSEQTLTQRKQIRRLIGEIVHATDASGGRARIPHILELGQKLKQAITLERK